MKFSNHYERNSVHFLKNSSQFDPTNFYIDASEVNEMNRLIFHSDLATALKYLESQLSSFHEARLSTVWLEGDQQPQNKYVHGQFFVVSKLLQNKNDNKQDISTRQVFHQFEPLKPCSSAPSAGVSPSKGVGAYQVAIAQEIAKGTPKRLAREMAKKSLQSKFDIFYLDLQNTPNGFCPCANQSERKYMSDNFVRLEDLREIENKKDLLKFEEHDRDIAAEKNNSIPESRPNQNNGYCQICGENYLDFMLHLTAENHKVKVKVNTDTTKQIDALFESLELEKRWKLA